MKSILAGIMIALSGILYLSVDNKIIGALLFAFGLFTILNLRFNLFTGKAGYLYSKEITLTNLIVIYVGNAIGTFIIGLIVHCTNLYNNLYPIANNIIQIRIQNTFIENVLFGFLCGVLMYIAVLGYSATKNSIFIAVPVMAFILSGFNHCIADLFYCSIVASRDGLLTIIPTTIGNFVGCNAMAFAYDKSHT